MQRRQFIRVLGGGVVMAVGATGLSACSPELPPEAVEAWRGPDAAEPDVRRWILSHAILAPHSHNLQSWLVDLKAPDQITLYLDRAPGRLLPQTDPWHRQMMMSQGTFLELLDLAARQRGLRAEITLFPQGEFEARAVDGRPTAHIRLLPDSAVQADPLFAQVLRRRTNRQAYQPQPPTPQAWQALEAAVGAAPQGAQMRAIQVGLQQPQLLQLLRAIAKQAWQIELVTPRTLLESYQVLRVGPKEIAQHRDGLSMNEPMVRVLVALGLFDRSQASSPDDPAITGQIKDFNAKIDSTPAFFALVSQGNSRKTQVHAGRAYVRAQLAATAHGLSMHPLSQALQEYPEQAQPYAAIHRLLEADPASHTVQIWTRLGYAPPTGPSPRRGLQAHLV